MEICRAFFPTNATDFRAKRLMNLQNSSKFSVTPTVQDPTMQSCNSVLTAIDASATIDPRIEVQYEKPSENFEK